MDLNKFICTGRLTATPEIKITPTNKKVCRFKVAINRTKAKDAEDVTDFPSFVAWESSAEFLQKYFTKGDPICIEARVFTDEYEVDGEKKYTTGFTVENIHFIGRKKNE